MATELSRYRFSRSICHRMDLLGLRDEAAEGDDDDDDPQEQEQQPKSRNCARRTTRSQSDRSRDLANPKVSYSKSLSFSHQSSSSAAAAVAEVALAASPRSSRSSNSNTGKDEGNKSSKLRRMVSWSSYLLEAKGDETAVEEAEEWMVDLSQLLLGHRFASGAHSRLYHGIYQGKPVAVKVIRQPQGADTGQLKLTLDRLFSREVSLLSRLHHPNIVQLMGACRRPQVCCVITEYLAGGSLRDFLSRKSGSPLPAQTIVAMALDVARGMSYLHSQGVVHRDLKSANLILTHDLCVKISDFGVATLESECNNVTPDVGTYRWMAPELVNRKAHSRKVDMYSYGVVLWELVTGRLPFHNMTPVQAAYAVVNKNARPEVPPNCPTVLSHLMQQCWSLHPDGRPDFDQAIVVLERFQASIEGDLGLASWQTPMQQLDNFSR